MNFSKCPCCGAETNFKPRGEGYEENDIVVYCSASCGFPAMYMDKKYAESFWNFEAKCQEEFGLQPCTCGSVHTFAKTFFGLPSYVKCADCGKTIQGSSLEDVIEQWNTTDEEE